MIYHITTRAEWQAAQSAGAYSAPSLENEGFIHCSRADQVTAVANAFYRTVPDLVLLCIEPDLLTAEVKWEAPVHPQGHEAPQEIDERNLFPHIYGKINLDAVQQVVDFPIGDDGTYTLPEDLPT